MAALLIFVLTLEVLLATGGYKPTVPDSMALWIKQRVRADHLGRNALILIGASRMQMDADLDVLRRTTGLDPVQLAIYGSTPLPVWRGLVADPRVQGTILFDYRDQSLANPDLFDPDPGETAARYERQFAGRPDHGDTRAWMVEELLGDWIRAHMAIYADGASPLDSLLRRAFPGTRTPQYLDVRPDRSRVADFSRMSMPQFYYARVASELGGPSPPVLEPPAMKHYLEQRIEQLTAVDNAGFIHNIQTMKLQVDALHKRGVQVIFVRMPVSGMVREIEDRRYPRDRFWDHFAAEIGAPAINFEDFPKLANINCPDGSHLDVRDRQRFSLIMAEMLRPQIQRH